MPSEKNIQIELAFVFSLTLVYLILEQSQFINAVDVFRPGVGFVVIVNLAGIFCALTGVCLQRDLFISVQIMLLLGLVCLSDLFAFILGIYINFHLNFIKSIYNGFWFENSTWKFLGCQIFSSICFG
ncbi:unnamed protein product [Meloidogyne enterolobii]|uniref:Uncharacterized protein n=1 Tax=Meloidogyne enterolobii TaxID=390850 RepID=A0ACB0YF87_MELEN